MITRRRLLQQASHRVALACGLPLAMTSPFTGFLGAAESSAASAGSSAPGPRESRLMTLSGSLVAKPDLLPQLTQQEVEPHQARWQARVQESLANCTEDQLTHFENARRNVQAAWPGQVHEVTFFSLFPTPQELLATDAPAKAEELQKNPTFHRYPILSQTTTSHAGLASQWLALLKNQILPNDFASCEFSPRHGYRLITGPSRPDGKSTPQTTDILMCYTCGHMRVILPTGETTYPEGHLSPFVRMLTNTLFDKLKLPRDRPARVDDL